MSFPLLPKDALDTLTSKVGPKSTVLATSVARLYVVSSDTGKQWRYTGISGIIAYVMDRESKVQTIRIYNSSTFSLRFQVEIPFEPQYSLESEYFHTLELDNDVLLGFLFALAREQNLPGDKTKTLT